MQPPHSGESKYLRLLTKPSPYLIDAELDFYLSIISHRLVLYHLTLKLQGVFFGLCKARDILKDNSIIAGISSSKTLIIPIEKELIGIDFRVFTDFNFIPSMDRSQLSNPLTEFYQSLGITQYIQQEVIEKKFLENLLAKENWQPAASKLEKGILKTD
jgi:hypothetical protein